MKRIHIHSSLLAIAVVMTTFLSACDEPADKDLPLAIAQEYDSIAYRQNTINQVAVIKQWSDLINEAKKGRTIGAKVSATRLAELFNTGSPNLKLVTTNYYAGRLENPTNGFFAELSKASGTTFNPFRRLGDGGVYGDYLFDENGLEMEQLIDKGLYGAMAYNYAVGLMENNSTLAAVDQIVALYGANLGFINSDNAEMYLNPDRFTAAYAAQREKTKGNGYYTSIRVGFLQLQAAFKSGDQYKTKRDEAFAQIKQNWEKVHAATVINRLHKTIAALSLTTPSTAQISTALHGYSEGVGLLHGWRTISQQHKKITDAQIEEVLTLMNAPYDKSALSYLFVSSPTSELPKLTQAIGRLKEIYGFSDQEIDDFKHDWVTEQKR
ncbi:hypothetical protein [Tellurirhabdus bombi]|uniref:hypothetical protein n=1 Tax=Tellurirhabdus bombi TaxID=2907205 RepID=UPI001F463ACC|nr:hypothetical protein [Tellurirhabdus bombi]